MEERWHAGDIEKQRGFEQANEQSQRGPQQEKTMEEFPEHSKFRIRDFASIPTGISYWFCFLRHSESMSAIPDLRSRHSICPACTRAMVERVGTRKE